MRIGPAKEGQWKTIDFSSLPLVEAAIWHYTGEVQEGRLNYGLRKFRRWYLGDGT
jgi:hypothetical protein